ncbi:hypothetical protein DACRYDRAFT_108451 [Dacryopinax primogenitus]|uniref:Uncharacterized protein n=1 Tax=Dacryopinax primogenitus (strain DJM 731) TaxID=1858805 RepID=M5FYZ8_DACPD|nr:uncharacterized protein DACRYDRAFT_108451 [Dacryopinax primogenitus]EJU01120.1 hypothetical protein DACRYDRAFT_108451 [Dacryopinax primogenitus]
MHFLTGNDQSLAPREQKASKSSKPDKVDVKGKGKGFSACIHVDRGKKKAQSYPKDKKICLEVVDSNIGSGGGLQEGALEETLGETEAEEFAYITKEKYPNRALTIECLEEMMGRKKPKSLLLTFMPDLNLPPSIGHPFPPAHHLPLDDEIYNHLGLDLATFDHSGKPKVDLCQAMAGQLIVKANARWLEVKHGDGIKEGWDDAMLGRQQEWEALNPEERTAKETKRHTAAAQLCFEYCQQLKANMKKAWEKMKAFGKHICKSHSIEALKIAFIYALWAVLQKFGVKEPEEVMQEALGLGDVVGGV